MTAKYTPDSLKAMLEAEQSCAPGSPGTAAGGSLRLSYDEFTKKWSAKFQLEPDRYWFLTVFIGNDGSAVRYSLDYEAASDSHYDFTDEAGMRRLLYRPGDEKLFLHQLFIRAIEESDGFALLNMIRPLITAEFHYD